MVNQSIGTTERYEGLLAYIERVKQEGISKDLLVFSLSTLDILIELIKERGYTLTIPDACPGESNNFMYVWSSKDHYLECEVFMGRQEFFYRNRTNGELWGFDVSMSKGSNGELVILSLEEEEEGSIEEFMEGLINRLMLFSLPMVSSN